MFTFASSNLVVNDTDACFGVLSFGAGRGAGFGGTCGFEASSRGFGVGFGFEGGGFGLAAGNSCSGELWGALSDGDTLCMSIFF